MVREQFRREGIRLMSRLCSMSQAIAGSSDKSRSDFVAHESLRSVIDREIAKVNRTLEDYEAIRNTSSSTAGLPVLPAKSPHLKLKRKVISQNFADEIDKLYQNAQVGEG